MADDPKPGTLPKSRADVTAMLGEIERERKKVVATGLKLGKALNAAEEMTAHLEKQSKGFQNVIEKVTPKDWTVKRYVWATISGIAGTALSLLLQKKVPAINQAACGVSCGMLSEHMGFNRSQSAIAGAAGAITGTWAADNFEPLSIGISAVSYGDFVFAAGEFLHEGWGEWQAEQKAKEKAKAKKSAA